MLPDVLVVPERAGALHLMDACEREATWGLLLERVPQEKVASYGIVKGEKLSEGNYLIEGAVEKPKYEEAPSDLAVLGRYLFPPEIFELIRRSKKGALGEIQLTDAIHALAQQKRGKGALCEGKIFDVGNPAGLQEIYHHLRSLR